MSRLVPKRYTNPLVRSFLDSTQAGLAEIYSRRISISKFDNPDSVAKYTHIADADKYISQKFAQRLKPKPFLTGATAIDLRDPKIMQSSAMDVELSENDKVSSLMLSSVDGMIFRFGDLGKAPSQKVRPKDLLKHELTIPERSLGILEIKNHVPFSIEAKNPEEAFAYAACELTEVVDHEKNIKRYSMDVLSQVSKDDIKRLSIELQRRIFNDHEKETFYEEVTSKVYKPTEYNRSSGTLMNFESEDYYRDKTTAMHYHPGERSLLIITTKKPAGVTLNFCGITENPDLRKDCEVHLDFPENSITILNFPPYTHHRFHGDFVCMSIHPREGVNLIKSLQSGTLPMGFLESATVFSSTERDEKWDLSIPTNQGISNKKPTSQER